MLGALAGAITEPSGGRGITMSNDGSRASQDDGWKMTKMGNSETIASA